MAPRKLGRNPRNTDKINGLCLKCWNRDKGKFCKRGFPQDRDIKNCRWYSGESKTSEKN
jgi:hypothetical protein